MGPQAHFGNCSKCGLRRIATWPAGRSAENDRHGSVVDELKRHPGAEDACLDIHAFAVQGSTEPFVEMLGFLGRGCTGKARPVSFRRVRNEPLLPTLPED